MEEIEYKVKVETDGPATVYLPVLTEMPRGNVSGLVGELEVKSGDRNASLEVIETRQGRALKVETDGNVTFSVSRGSGYFEAHPGMGGRFSLEEGVDPTFLNFTMTVDGSQPGRRMSDNRSEGRHWFYLDPGSEGPARVDIYASARNEYGVEWWEFDRKLEPGWQNASMGRSVGVY